MITTYTKLFLLFCLLSASISLQAQTNQNSPSYFPGTYSQQPIITFKEGFLNQTTYYLDGEKSSAKEVGDLLNSIENEDFEFLGYQRKKGWGTAINLTGLAVNLGSIAYLITNEITPATIRPWFLVTLGGGVLLVTGDQIVQNAQKKIPRSFDDFNAYHYSGGINSYLRMDVKDGFLAPKIDIYEGPMLLQKDQVLSRLQANEQAYQLYEQVLKRQKVSTVTHIANAALGIGVIFAAIGYEQQSSSQNDLLIPMSLTGIGLGIFSKNYDRKTRNLTRKVLQGYNYR
ncbi:MAG: hypothetical protein P8O16_08630 [Algoriphagus sp.]|uniref:hypothetical protein n=1 Tax=Algoriphagus sp. TaxID=1872435 RepID=UPI00260E9CDA|nr:hypothetical protein [Algoriphagus sp.]MDG1277331.1 hypothetical protein [Algoriphagus sp.]